MVDLGQAIALDESGEVREAIAAYEAIIASHVAPVDAFINLAYLYALPSDYGFLVAHRLTPAFRDECFEKFDDMIREGLEAHPSSQELLVVSLYVPSQFWDRGTSEQVAESLASQGVPRSALGLIGVGSREELVDRARAVLASIEGQGTQRARYLRSVAEARLKRLGEAP